MTSIARTPLYHLAKALLQPTAALLLFASFSCSNGAASLPGVPGSTTNASGPIDTGNPCSSNGAQTPCGNTIQQQADYVVCAVGTRTCQNGIWGTCIDTGQRQIQSLSERLQTVGSTKACGSWNPCDPYCQEIDDNPNNVIPGADAGLVIDGGVTLALTQIQPGSSTCTSLQITASSPTLTVSQLSPITTNPTQLTVSAQLQPPSCYPTTTPVLWSIDRTDIATIDSSGKLSLITPVATPIVITGHSGSFVGSTTVQVSVNVTDNHLAPSGTINQFTGATTADTVTLLYPYAQTVLPLGLASPLLQWSTGANGAAAAVKISLRFPAATGANFNWSAIVPENSSLVLDPNNPSNALAPGPRCNIDSIDSQAWRLFERTALGQDAAIVVQRLTGAPPSTLGAELPTTIHFASNQLKGTVYYHSYGTNLVKNFGKYLSERLYVPCPTATPIAGNDSDPNIRRQSTVRRSNLDDSTGRNCAHSCRWVHYQRHNGQGLPRLSQCFINSTDTSTSDQPLSKHRPRFSDL